MAGAEFVAEIICQNGGVLCIAVAPNTEKPKTDPKKKTINSVVA
jgi:hypothetical protein